MLLFAYTLYWIAHRPWQIIHDDVIDMLWKFKVFGTAAWKFLLSFYALLLNFLLKFSLFLLPWGGWNTHLCYYNVMLCCLTSLPSLVLTYFIIYNIKRRRQFIYIFSVLLFYSFFPFWRESFFHEHFLLTAFFQSLLLYFEMRKMIIIIRLGNSVDWSFFMNIIWCLVG